MNLDSTTKIIQVVLGEAKTTNDCNIVSAYADSTSTTFTLINTNIDSNGTTPVTAVPAPAAGAQRQVKEVRLFNNDTVPHTVTMQLYDGTATWIIAPAKVTIPAGGGFVYTPDTGATGLAGSGSVTGIVAGNNLTGGTITTSGTIGLQTLAATSLFGNAATVAGTMAAVAIGAGLSLAPTGTLTATGGGSVASVIAQGGPFLANGTITTAGTIDNSSSSLTPHGIIIGEGTSAVVATAAMTNGQLLLGATGADPAPQTMSGDATINAGGTITVSKAGGVTIPTLAALGVVINSGTIEIHNIVTLAGTAGSTTTIAPGSGTSDVVVTIPTSGTVTLAASPTFKRQRVLLDISFGATAGAVSLNSGFVFGNGPSAYVPGTVANEIDRLLLMSPDGTKFAVMAIDQGFTV